MKLLTQDLFNKSSNVAKSFDGWLILDYIDTLSGNDIISGTARKSGNGIALDGGQLYTSSGHDVVYGRGKGGNSNGIFFEFGRKSTINTGTGNDIVKGVSTLTFTQAGIGIYGIGSELITGPGDDNVIGKSFGFGIVNYGRIDTGTGNDIVTGIGLNGAGIFIGIGDSPASLNTGNGNDTIIGTSATVGINVANDSMIDTGHGNDKITGSGGLVGIIIQDQAIIQTGRGNDVVDALIGGFNSTGCIDLGKGRDILRGFGSGTFIGGDGVDQIQFGEGIYTISKSNGTISKADDPAIMSISQFERIGGTKGSLFAIENGILTVGNDGYGEFLAP